MVKLLVRCFLILLLLPSYAYLGCDLSKEQPVAKVGSERLMLEDIDMIKFQHIPDSTRSFPLLSYVNNWVDQELMYQEAQRQKIKLTPALENELERVRKSMYVNLFLKDRIEQIISVTDAEVQKYYDEHQDEFYATDDFFSFLAIKTSDRSLSRTPEMNLKTRSDIITMYEENPDKCEIVSFGEESFSSSNIEPELRGVLKKNISNRNFFKAALQGETYFIRITEAVEEGGVKNFQMVTKHIHDMLILAKRKEKYLDLISRLRTNIEHEINMDILMNGTTGR